MAQEPSGRAKTVRPERERPLPRGSVPALREALAVRPGRSKVVPRFVQVALSITLRAFFVCISPEKAEKLIF